MKKNKCLFGLILIFSFTGCSNEQSEDTYIQKNDTVKQYIQTQEENIVWTKELESNILNTNISYEERITNQEYFDKESLKILPYYKNPVYPSLNNFGSLDSSSLSKNQKEILNKFINAISQDLNNGPEQFFNSKFIFNYVFFKNEIEKKLLQNESEEMQTEESEKAEKEPLFTKWYVGEPFINKELVEVPVRLFSTIGIIDVTILIDTGSNEIYQIVINRWEN